MARDKPPRMSLFNYLSSEVTRGYVLEHDEERYTTRRQKMYTFMKIPRELEKFMSYGFFHCLDSFLFVFTFLPIRFFLAILALVVRTPLHLLGLARPYHGRLLFPAEIIDLLKGLIIGVCVYVMSHIDTSMMYHLIKSQSVIKLYLFYNMLEVGDRLFSAFGQDTIDALFWTATEPRDRKREHIGVIPHFMLTITYVILHTLLVLLQATTLNVAINASNKALLTIMMSNNFVELKGSVFKKFDKNNLFQVSCSDVRERFHLFALLFIVVVQTMKEYGWKEESFWTLAPDCLLVLSAEFLVDWIKHAFITRFNEVSAEVYKDYTTFLAYDLAQTKQKHAFSDHSDIVSRRMGFIPLPLGVVMIRVIGTAVRGNTHGAPIIFILAYLCLLTFRILASVVILGKACDLIDHHQQTKKSPSSPQKQPPQQQPPPKEPEKQQQSKEEVKATEVKTEGQPVKEPIVKDLESDMALLESKLQSIVDSSLPTAGSGTPPPRMAIVPPAIIAEEDEEDVEMETISSNINRPSLLHTTGESYSSSTSDEFQHTRGRAPARRAQSGDSPTTTTLQAPHNTSQHRWSNRRSVMMASGTPKQGELNRVVFSDSRRRPLSCTPPSTSLSTSVSIDEDDVEEHKVAFNDNKSFDSSNVGQQENMRLSSTVSEDTTCTSSTDEQQQQQQHLLPDLIAAQESKNSKVVSSESIEKDFSSESSVEVKLKSDESEETAETISPSMRPKSLSSPDFLKVYRGQYDAERDWPVLDSDSEAGDEEVEEEESDEVDNRKKEFLSQISSSKTDLQSNTTSSSSRRGSSEDSHGVRRRRKRYDTDRV